MALLPTNADYVNLLSELKDTGYALNPYATSMAGSLGTGLGNNLGLSGSNIVSLAGTNAGTGSGLSLSDVFGNQGIIGGVTQGLGALAGLASGIGGYINGRKQISLMKDQLNFMKDAAKRNYNAQVQTYNTSLSDRYRGRSSYETGALDSYQSEYEANKMDKI